MKKFFNVFAVLLLLVGTMAPSFTNAISIPQKVDICHDGETVESHMYNHFDWECLDWSGTGRFKWCEQRGWTPKNGSHSNDYAGACEEVCDGVDNDGDDAIDEGFDLDQDGIADCNDNCPETVNQDQADADDDQIGDACDTPECGNSVQEGDEACDDGMYGSETCTADCTLRPTTAKVVAQKIVCNDEADLPNWGSEGAAPITSTTAQEFVDASDENCWFAEGRSFQWGNDDVTNPGDEYYGAAENGWNTFGTTDDDGMTMTEIPVGDNEHFWIREVLQDGYIPFTYEASEGNSNDVSAEIYCATDAINYDNFDRIDAPVAGETYYCVAFNVAEEEVPACGNGEIDRMNYLTKTVQIDDIQIPVGEECDDGNTVDGDGCSSECTIEYICEFEESNGWYGQYYNYPSTHPDMNLSPEVWPDAGHGDPEAGLGWDTDWYDNTYFKFAKVDANLEFGTNFFPFDGAWSEELSSNNHEHHFGVHWSAQTYIANTGTYNFTMTTDDDIWVYVDGVLVDQTAGIHPATANAFSVALNPGTHIFDIYYADRHITKTHMYFTSLDQLTFVPYNENCNEVDPICGNEVVESGETCDDGNDIAGDGCENNCTVSVCNPQQNLVYNGGFEEPALDANTWSIIPNVAGGWTVEAAGTDTPDGLEIQNSLWTPYEGVQYAELDGNLSTEIGQTLTTIPGQNYSLNFALSARPGVVISSNGIEVYWNGVLVAPVIVLDGSANSDTAWSTYSYNVLAVGTSSTLLIKDAGISDTLGMFVDNVSVMCPMVQDGCGDGNVDEGEECDDGNNNNDDACDNECYDNDEEYVPTCGDGIPTSINGEACDDGNEDNTDGCTTYCELPTCGDGFVQNYEQGEVVYTEACDDGNDLYNDGCNNYCEVDQICEVPDSETQEYQAAVVACTPQMEEDTMYSRVMKKLSLIEIVDQDFDQCITNYFCDDECIDTFNADYNVYAYDNSVANTPLTTSISVVPGDFLTITADSTDTWSAGADDRISNADGLISGNIYGGNYGLYNNGTAEFPYGALVGHLFGSSNYFLVGTSFAGVMTETGVLQLMYWDSNYEDNADLVYVDIALERGVSCDEDSTCGDGVVNQESEECDDGNAVNGDSCKNNCELPGGGGGSSCTVNCDGDDTPDELLRTGGDGDGDTTDEEEPKDKPRTSTPLTFGPQSSIALQLPAMLAATGATVQSTSMWMVLFILSALGLAAVATSNVISKK